VQKKVAVVALLASGLVAGSAVPATFRGAASVTGHWRGDVVFSVNGKKDTETALVSVSALSLGRPVGSIRWSIPENKRDCVEQIAFAGMQGGFVTLAVVKFTSGTCDKNEYLWNYAIRVRPNKMLELRAGRICQAAAALARCPAYGLGTLSRQ
jgi:hypothetical protein